MSTSETIMSKIDQQMDQVKHELNQVTRELNNLENDKAAKEEDETGWLNQIITLLRKKSQLQETENSLLAESRYSGEYPNLSNDASDDEHLKLAIRLAQTFLNTIEFKGIYEKFYSSENAIKSMSNVTICFAVQTKFNINPKTGKKINDLGWTDRKQTNIIWINNLFKSRLKSLNKYELPEKESILFMIAVVIVHELGHLMLRWAGKKQTPKEYNEGGWLCPEAGFFLESQLFGSTVHLRIPQNTEWTATTTILGVCVMKYRATTKTMEYFPVDSDLIKRLVNGENVQTKEYLPLPAKKNPINKTSERALRPGCGIENEETLENEVKPVGLGDNERILFASCNLDKTGLFY